MRARMNERLLVCPRRALPLFLVAGLLGAVAAGAATFTVNNSGDAGDDNLGDNVCHTAAAVCTLRAAIQQANATAGTDTITFSISGTISPASALPSITQAVTLRGTSGASCPVTPGIVLGGGSAGAAVSGLTLATGSGGSTICGLTIQAFSAHGLVVNTDGNTVRNNFIGTNSGGTAAAGNGGYGIVVTGSNNTLGTSTYTDRNIVSGNLTGGIYVNVGTGNQVRFSFIGTNYAGTAAIGNTGSGITFDATSGNTLVQDVISGNSVNGVLILAGGSNTIVTNNLIGLNQPGNAALPNASYGVYISASSSNTIGNVASGGNIVSGNGVGGVYITGASSANLIQANFIGTRLGGVVAQGNGGNGVEVAAGSGNRVGNVGAGLGNVISGNLGSGVVISGGSGHFVLSNAIGTNPTGSGAIANSQHGVAVVSSANNTIGITGVDGSGNIVSGNGGNGIFVTGAPSTGTVIRGNTIGARQDGQAAIANGGHGIVLVGVNSAMIGGDVSGEDNEVAGNAQNGIYISGGASNQVRVNEVGIDGSGEIVVPNGLAGILVESATGTLVRSSLVSGNAAEGIRVVGGSGTQIRANLVGTNVGGTARRPNGGSGISIESSPSNTVGLAVGGEGNVVSGNNGAGISITGAPSTGNVVQNTLVGLDVSATTLVANLGHGIVIQGASGNTIGGTAPANSNFIAGNGGVGVAVLSGTGNRIRLNQIYSNTGIGIDLDRDGVAPPDGVTYNDLADADTGANALQNHPVLTDATDVNVNGIIRGAPSTAYIIDLFASAACDSAGFGEGTAFKGTTTVTTNPSGVATFLLGFPSVGPSTAFAATATDPAGNTSEFSECITVNHVPVETLTLFAPAQSFVSLIGSPNDLPPLSAYTSFVSGAPVQGQWVMGDWNGDGIQTPAVYGDNGAFYYTNDVGQTGSWTGIWFGLLGKPPVAGRFDGTVNHDCLGVVDSTPWPPYGTAFAMYFTCDLTGGPNPPKDSQWLGAPLPDNGGFSGEGAHQFVAADFDADGVDTMASRRGHYIAWTNTPPTTLVAPFDQAQYIGAPGSGYGQVVAGDWDGNGLDSFGLFYTDGSFYRRNDLVWNSGTYDLQRVGQPIGPAATAQSWRPGASAGF